MTWIALTVNFRIASKMMFIRKVNDTATVPKTPSRMTENVKKKRADAKAKGLCVVCQKKPANRGVHCYECWLRQKRNYRKRRSNKRELWKEEGKCYFCGRDPIEGKKVCEFHYPGLKAKADYMHSLPQTKESQRRFTQWHWRLREAEKIK